MSYGQNSDWHTLSEKAASADVSGLLYEWNTTSLPATETAAYDILVTAWNQAGASRDMVLHVILDNIAPRLDEFSAFPEFISPVAGGAGSTQTASSVHYKIMVFDLKGAQKNVKLIFTNPYLPAL